MLQYTLYSPAFHVTMLALVGMMAFQGLVAIWAATSRLHWFWRALGVWAAVMLLVPIRAYEPALVFAMASPLIVLAVLGMRTRFPLARTSVPNALSGFQWRFGLRDLFLLLLLVGLTLAGLTSITRSMRDVDWPLALFIVAVFLAIPIALSYGAVSGAHWWLWLVILVPSIPTAAAFILELGDLNLGWSQMGIAYESNLGADDVIILSVFLLALTAAIAGLAWLARQSLRSDATRYRTIARVVLAAVVLVAVVPLAWLYYEMLWLTPFPPSMTGPNHYDRISEIAKQVSAGKCTAAELAHLHDDLLTLLAEPNYIPFDPSRDLHDDYWGLITPWRDLARSLEAEGDSAALRGEYERAAEYARANMRLGIVLKRGGLRLQYLVGNALEGMGRSQIITWRNELPAKQLRQAMEDLQRCDREIEPLELINARDRAFDERVYGWEFHWDYVLSEILRRDFLETEYNSVRDRSQVNRWLLQTDLAVRLYAADKGQFPQSLDQLTPDYLPRSLDDPHSQKPFVYRVEGSSFVLYSVGKDGQDQGGRFADAITYNQETGFDLDLETMTPPLTIVGEPLLRFAPRSLLGEPMKDEKRFLRELKRTVKKAGNRKRRRYLKDISAEAEEFSFGRDRTDVMNEKPRKKNTARTQSGQSRPTDQPVADSEPADIAGRPAPD